MGIIAADLFITLDGVYQAPGGRDEDRSDGFEFGGWQAPFGDEAIGASIMSSIERTDALLLGRRTYDIFSSFWPFQPLTDPVAAKFAAIPKYVVSRTLIDPELGRHHGAAGRRGRRVAARPVRRGAHLGQRRAAAEPPQGRARWIA